MGMAHCAVMGALVTTPHAVDTGGRHHPEVFGDQEKRKTRNQSDNADALDVLSTSTNIRYSNKQTPEHVIRASPGSGSGLVESVRLSIGVNVGDGVSIVA